MTNETRNKIIHSLLFNLCWGGIIYIQTSQLVYKPALLSATALIFVGVHFLFFASDFLKELIFLAVGFCIGLFVEAALSNSGVYHYGLVDTAGLSWPPPWIASMWLMFPPLITYTFGFLKSYPIVGSAFIAASTLSSYYFVGKKMDLIFFNKPLASGFVVFIIFWFLALRFLVRLKVKLKI